MLCWLLWWQVAVMTCADTGDNAGLWHSHHLLTCTDDVLITMWSMSMIHVHFRENKIHHQSSPSSGVSRMRTFFLACFLGSLFPCDILCSKCREYVTFHVHWTGVQSACTLSVQHLYTTVPGNTLSSEETSTRSTSVNGAPREQVRFSFLMIIGP